MSHRIRDDIVSLLELSARIGRNPLLTQASTGNVSVKDDQLLWVKASGTWLAHADRQDILTPVDLDSAREAVKRGVDPAKPLINPIHSHTPPSVETALHVVLPHRIVIHLHSVNVIGWAVRQDGPACLAERLSGLRWRWIPYVRSGLPLATAVEHAVCEAPETEVLILANHGLVVGARNCSQAEALLWEVERRVAMTPRPVRKPDLTALGRIAADSDWRLPVNVTIHALATDPESTRILSGGILYPCQALFSNSDPASLYRAVPPALLRSEEAHHRGRPFLIVQGRGILAQPDLSAAEAATLKGLAQVIRRIPEYAAVRYLTEHEIAELDMQAYVATSSRYALFASRTPAGN